MAAMALQAAITVATMAAIVVATTDMATTVTATTTAEFTWAPIGAGLIPTVGMVGRIIPLIRPTRTVVIAIPTTAVTTVRAATPVDTAQILVTAMYPQATSQLLRHLR